MFYDTPHLFFNTRFANNPPWGAQITLPNPAGGFADPYLDLSRRQPVPGADHRTGQTQPFPAFGVYVNAPLDTEPTSLQQWNVSVQRQFGDWLLPAQLPRQPLEPPVARHRAELRRSSRPARRPATPTSAACSILQNPAQGAVLRHDRPARRHGPRQLPRPAAVGAAPAEEQPQRAVQLHAVEVHERSGDDRDHRADDRRSRPTRISTTRTALGSPSRRQRLGRGADADVRRTTRCSAVFSDWQFAPLVRWQSGNRFIGHDRRRQRADRHGRPAGGADPRRPSTATARSDNYLNRAAFTSPAAGTYSDAEAVHDRRPVAAPERPRDHADVPGVGRTRLQFRWEIFNVINHVNFNAPTSGAQQRELRPDPDGRATRASCSSR